MASAVKAAGFAVFVRVLAQAFFDRELALSPGPGAGSPVGWFQLLVWMAIATMIVGNVVAVLQRNLTLSGVLYVVPNICAAGE